MCNVYNDRQLNSATFLIMRNGISKVSTFRHFSWKIIFIELTYAFHIILHHVTAVCQFRMR